MKNRTRLWEAMRSIAIALVAIIGFTMTACDNGLGGNPIDEPLKNSFAINYSSYLSQFLGWQWENSDGFLWTFKNNGTVSVEHHCGLIFDNQFSYLLCGDVLITYGTEMDEYDTLLGTNFTMADDGAFFIRVNGSKKLDTFYRRNADSNSFANRPLVLSNDLLGTWQGVDGTEYTFSDDAGLWINSPSGGSGQYGYLVRKTEAMSQPELVTLGPLVEGTEAVLKKYQFNLTGGKKQLSLSSGGQTINLLKK